MRALQAKKGAAGENPRRTFSSSNALFEPRTSYNFRCPCSCRSNNRGLRCMPRRPDRRSSGSTDQRRCDTSRPLVRRSLHPYDKVHSREMVRTPSPSTDCSDTRNLPRRRRSRTASRKCLRRTDRSSIPRSSSTHAHRGHNRHRRRKRCSLRSTSSYPRGTRSHWRCSSDRCRTCNPGPRSKRYCRRSFGRPRRRSNRCCSHRR